MIRRETAPASTLTTASIRRATPDSRAQCGSRVASPGDAEPAQPAEGENTMNRDNDMAHTINAYGPKGYDALRAGRVVATSVNATANAFEMRRDYSSRSQRCRLQKSQNCMATLREITGFAKIVIK